MTGKTFREQEHIRVWIGIYLDEFGMTSLRSISKWLKEKINIEIPPSTVARLVRDRGFEMKKGEWVRKS